MSFRVYSVIEQKNWDLGDDGEKLDADNPRVWSRVLSSRIAVSQSSSTGELIGIYTVEGNSVDDSLGTADSVRMMLTELDDGTPALKMELKTVLYGDFFAKGDSSVPGISSSTELLFVKEDKLHAKLSYSSYRVEPDSLKMVEGSEPRNEESEEHELE